jgi:hypothetical protein
MSNIYVTIWAKYIFIKCDSTKHLSGHQIKKVEIGGARGLYGTHEKYIQGFRKEI